MLRTSAVVRSQQLPEAIYYPPVPIPLSFVIGYWFIFPSVFHAHPRFFQLFLTPSPLTHLAGSLCSRKLLLQLHPLGKGVPVNISVPKPLATLKRGVQNHFDQILTCNSPSHGCLSYLPTITALPWNLLINTCGFYAKYLWTSFC